MDVETYGALLEKIKNNKGEKGDKGKDGAAATITVGTVSKGTLAVENVGTSADAIFNFTFPYSTSVTASDDGNGNVILGG